VNIHVQPEDQDLYDADFLRIHREKNWLLFADDYWNEYLGTYTPVTAYTVVHVDYKGTSHSSAISSHSYGAPLESLAPSHHEDAHLYSIQVADLSQAAAVGALAPPDGGADVVAARPQKRMKKIKFLQPDAPAGEPMEH